MKVFGLVSSDLIGSSDLQGAELVSCLCVWVLTSVDDVTARAEATAHLADAPEHHDWTLHDLSVLWRTLLGRGRVAPLLRGFQLFQRVRHTQTHFVKGTVQHFTELSCQDVERV